MNPIFGLIDTVVCTKCKISKPKTAYYKEPRTKKGIQAACKSCVAEYKKKYERKYSKQLNVKRKEWKRKNPEKVSKYYRHDRLKLYGLTEQDYNILVKNQNNRCGICKKEEQTRSKYGMILPLSVDHCHTTGQVRGLLCTRCNLMLGKVKDNIQILENAIEYLKNVN